MNNLKCYAVLQIPDGYEDFLEYIPKYTKEIFDCTEAKFDTDNVEGLISFFIDVYKIKTFDLYWTILDLDHFKELFN